MICHARNASGAPYCARWKRVDRLLSNLRSGHLQDLTCFLRLCAGGFASPWTQTEQVQIPNENIDSKVGSLQQSLVVLVLIASSLSRAHKDSHELAAQANNRSQPSRGFPSRPTLSRLSSLQDSVRPHSFEQTAFALEESLGPDWSKELQIDAVPIGSGCMAQ
eukprot:3949731-Amphidinium_carterae.1